MEDILEQSLLFDFYGELLTVHQKLIYEDFVLNDLSLSEIAQEREISRQGVYDIVRRSRRQLEAYEDKLHLVEKFIHTKEKVAMINRYANNIIEHPGDYQQTVEHIKRIEELSNTIIEEM